MYETELSTALAAVTQAARLCREVQRTVDVEALEKADRSPVTLADFAGQAVISHRIKTAFPEDPIVGEEAADALRENAGLLDKLHRRIAGAGETLDKDGILAAIDAGGGRGVDFSGRYWTVDPIDGTKGFLRGDQYAVALALVEGGRVVLGLLGCPNFRFEGPDGTPAAGCIFHARAGQGAHRLPLSGGAAPVPIRGDDIGDPSRARFCESFEKAHASHETHARISDHLGITAPPCRMDSQAKYGAVACGEASIYLRLPRSAAYREKIWDHAAGSILVEEAGGRVTDFRGDRLDFSAGPKLQRNHGVLATNGRLHQQALAAIAAVVF